MPGLRVKATRSPGGGRVILWLDAQLSPALADWLSDRFAVDAVAVREVDMARATDEAIFQAARRAGAAAITKDRDFVNLVERHGPPPQIIWLTRRSGSCGRSSNADSTGSGGSWTRANPWLRWAGHPLARRKIRDTIRGSPAPDDMPDR